VPSIDGMSIDEVTSHPKDIGWNSALDRLQGVTACNYSKVCKAISKHDDKKMPLGIHTLVDRFIPSYQPKMGT
jgi:hypothetical protein